LKEHKVDKEKQGCRRVAFVASKLRVKGAMIKIKSGIVSDWLFFMPCEKVERLIVGHQNL
jgi:hypothetical protein